mmetsp:Transcript_46888/g.100292  ORF Transcript_46888/g.100292 Transcript_46888/m.100292 type:complete len:202 (+) Transcript_46888:883-1488(+)
MPNASSRAKRALARRGLQPTRARSFIGSPMHASRLISSCRKSATPAQSAASRRLVQRARTQRRWSQRMPAAVASMFRRRRPGWRMHPAPQPRRQPPPPRRPQPLPLPPPRPRAALRPQRQLPGLTLPRRPPQEHTQPPPPALQQPPSPPQASPLPRQQGPSRQRPPWRSTIAMQATQTGSMVGLIKRKHGVAKMRAGLATS